MTTSHTNEESDRIIADGLRAVDEMREHLAAIEQDKVRQPQALAAARRAAHDAREATIEAEPWTDTLNITPTVDSAGGINGMATFPGVEAKEIWGARLLFDLIGCTNGDDDIDATLNRYFSLLNGDIGHLFIVMSAALVTAADTVIPMLLQDIEQHGSNYRARVYLAHAARKSWELRVNDHKADDDA